MGAGRARAGCRDDQGQGQAQASSAAMYFLLSTLESTAGCGAVRCGAVRCGGAAVRLCGMRVCDGDVCCDVCCDVRYGLGSWRATRCPGRWQPSMDMGRSAEPWAARSGGCGCAACDRSSPASSSSARSAKGRPLQARYTSAVRIVDGASSDKLPQHLEVQTSNPPGPCRHRSPCAYTVEKEP